MRIQWESIKMICYQCYFKSGRTVRGNSYHTDTTIEPQFSNTLVLKQLGSRPGCSWEKCLGCLKKLQVPILYPTTLSRWYLCDQSCTSQVTKKGDSAFEQTGCHTVFWKGTKSESRGCTVLSNVFRVTGNTISGALVPNRPWSRPAGPRMQGRCSGHMYSPQAPHLHLQYLSPAAPDYGSAVHRWRKMNVRYRPL